MRRPGRPSVSEEVYALSALLESDRRHTIRELARETGLVHTTVLHILKELLGMRKIASRGVPHDLAEMQKWLRYDATRNHMERYEREGEAFLRRIITLDETWAKPYEPQMEHQSNEWRHYGSPQKSKVRQNPSNVKVMMMLVYDCDGVILTHTVPRQQTVTAQHYCSLLEHNLRPALRKKQRNFLQNPPIILQENARPQAALAMADLFDRWGWEVLYHPPYSPDLSACDFDLTRRKQQKNYGKRFLSLGPGRCNNIRTVGSCVFCWVRLKLYQSISRGKLIVVS
ncbi:hypothetical protein B7P43_G01544 [Cryptotermes secundus]|uniref:Uncharacterized protein n=1 Tax=Cryptotermes secundus TaxID=105785 RepID=A0A2J7PF66_9NEOP|nr:hypothetical protein B7P43_G01544 [Cryptotermes secundus]